MPSYFWASGRTPLWVFKSQQHQKPSQVPFWLLLSYPRPANLSAQLIPHSVAWQPQASCCSFLPSPPDFLHLCSWQLPSSPRTHGGCWEDSVGGAGHKVRDLPQSPDVGGVVPLLHLFLDEALQLLPERLKQTPSCWSPSGSHAGD